MAVTAKCSQERLAAQNPAYRLASHFLSTAAAASAGCALSNSICSLVFFRAIAGVISPLVMHSPVGLATASLLMMSIGIVAWIWGKPKVV